MFCTCVQNRCNQPAPTLVSPMLTLDTHLLLNTRVGAYLVLHRTGVFHGAPLGAVPRALLPHDFNLTRPVHILRHAQDLILPSRIRAVCFLLHCPWALPPPLRLARVGVYSRLPLATVSCHLHRGTCVFSTKYGCSDFPLSHPLFKGGWSNHPTHSSRKIIVENWLFVKPYRRLRLTVLTSIEDCHYTSRQLCTVPRGSPKCRRTHWL